MYLIFKKIYEYLFFSPLFLFFGIICTRAFFGNFQHRKHRKDLSYQSNLTFLHMFVAGTIEVGDNVKVGAEWECFAIESAVPTL